MSELSPHEDAAAEVLAQLIGDRSRARQWLRLTLDREARSFTPPSTRLKDKAHAERQRAKLLKILEHVNAVDDYAREQSQFDIPEEERDDFLGNWHYVYRDLQEPLDEMRQIILSNFHAIGDHVLPKLTLSKRGAAALSRRLDTLTDLWGRLGGVVSAENATFEAFLKAGTRDLWRTQDLKTKRWLTSTITRYGERHDLRRPPGRPPKKLPKKV